jgi:hypothetical protein
MLGLTRRAVQNWLVRAMTSESSRLYSLRFQMLQTHGFRRSPDTILPDIESGPAFAKPRLFAHVRSRGPTIGDIAGTEKESGFRDRHLAAPQRGTTESASDTNVTQPWDVVKAEIRIESITNRPSR